MLLYMGLPTTADLNTSGIITSAIRFATFFTIDVFSDPTYYVVTSMTWTCIEPGVYFIAATLPSLRPLARQVSRIIDFSTLYSRCVRVGYTVFSISRTAIAKDENSQSTSRSSDQKGFSKLKPREARIVEPGVQGGKTDYTGSVRQGTPRISGQAESFELV